MLADNLKKQGLDLDVTWTSQRGSWRNVNAMSSTTVTQSGSVVFLRNGNVLGSKDKIAFSHKVLL